MTNNLRFFLALTIPLGLSACGGGSSEPADDASSLSAEMIAVGEAVGAGEYAFETVDYLSHNFGSLDDGKGNKYMVRLDILDRLTRSRFE